MNNQFEKASAKLNQYLLSLKRFPDQSRKSIYISSLQIPKNYKHLTQLCQPPVPLVEHTIDKDTCTLVSTLVKFNPSLNIQWIPGIIYPFAKLFKKDLLAQFQISLTFLYNWAINWFKDYPTPPRDIVDFIAQQLPELSTKVNYLGAQFSSLIWPMFLVLFTDILNKQDWLQLFDYILVNPQTPQLLICFISSLLKSLQKYLLKCQTLEDMHKILRKQRKVDIDAIIKNGVQLNKRQKVVLKQLYRDRLFPLAAPQYSILSLTQKGFFDDSQLPSKIPMTQQLQNIQKIINRFQQTKKWETSSKQFKNEVDYKKLKKGQVSPIKRNK